MKFRNFALPLVFCALMALPTLAGSTHELVFSLDTGGHQCDKADPHEHCKADPAALASTIKGVESAEVKDGKLIVNAEAGVSIGSMIKAVEGRTHFKVKPDNLLKSVFKVTKGPMGDGIKCTKCISMIKSTLYNSPLSKDNVVEVKPTIDGSKLIVWSVKAIEPALIQAMKKAGFEMEKSKI